LSPIVGGKPRRGLHSGSRQTASKLRSPLPQPISLLRQGGEGIIRYVQFTETNLGPLRPGQTKSLSVVFVAKSSHGIWGWHRYHTTKVKVTGTVEEKDGKMMLTAEKIEKEKD